MFNHGFQCGSTIDNIDEWRWKLTMLLRSKEEQEVVSREKKDRRDFDQLSALASRMGLYRYYGSLDLLLPCMYPLISLFCLLHQLFMM